MVRTQSKNKKPIFIISAIIAAVLICVGSFFIGYNAGRASNYPVNDVVYTEDQNKVYGVYSRQYYDDRNRSQTMFLTLKEDGSCAYRSVFTSSTDSVDLDEVDKRCSYTYDDQTKNGELTISYASPCQLTELTCASEDKKITHKFSYNDFIMRVGASNYTKIKRY